MDWQNCLLANSNAEHSTVKFDLVWGATQRLTSPCCTAVTANIAEMSGRCRGTQLFLPQGLLEQAIGARLQNDPMNLVSKRRLLSPGRVAMQSLRQLIVELTQIIDNDKESIVESLCTSSLINKLVDRISEALCEILRWHRRSMICFTHAVVFCPELRDIFGASGRESIQLYELCKRAWRQCTNAANHFQAGLRYFPDAIPETSPAPRGASASDHIKCG